jgi:uncharacterized membrane protein YhaH (DUF805 family)
LVFLTGFRAHHLLRLYSQPCTLPAGNRARSEAAKGKKVTFSESIKSCFSKYADFKGVASKSEFWWWALFILIATICLSIVNEKLSLAFTVATILPYIAVTTRRLHDVGKSGWAQLVGLIPVIGWIVVIVWLCQDSKPSTTFN